MKRDLGDSLFADPSSGPRRAFPSDLRPGRRVSSSIELVRPIASGGMGQVWLAEHRGLDIQVAVKFMRRDVADDPVSLARFEQEAKLAARIKSPHVVEVFDYDVTDTGLPFIVMESLHGQDLETVMQNGRTLSISDTARVLVQVCKALSKAHAVGVIHRDIKAENVFVVQDEGGPLIKVLDFGVAKETMNGHGISLSGTTVGTPAYMSPEQLFHPKEIDLRTDLWATAVLAYRCLTGSFPFGGESFPSVCLSVSKGKFAPPSTVNSVLPGGLDAWFKKAFHKSLDARFSSAAEMAESFLSELRKADLLPAWADSSARQGPSSRSSSSALRPTSARRAPATQRTRVLQVGASLATLLFIALSPVPTRAAVIGLAATAAEHARTWAVGEGLLPPTLNSTDDGASPEARAADVALLAPPSHDALAERDVPAVETARVALVVRKASIAAKASPDTNPYADVTPDGASAMNTHNESAITLSPPSITPKTQETPAPAAPPATSQADLATIRFGL